MERRAGVAPLRHKACSDEDLEAIWRRDPYPVLGVRNPRRLRRCWTFSYLSDEHERLSVAEIIDLVEFLRTEQQREIASEGNGLGSGVTSSTTRNASQSSGFPIRSTPTHGDDDDDDILQRQSTDSDQLPRSSEQ
eukprot:TRINITY_DN13576_c0_g1_i1.p2 TRINITY_DN13576_c0_g1~~TRINITY_DN13576_c0_g1_i1.p2  ORF type:complete len:135 (-),score=25.72 TRINITY_DN13576_c0_g1_i1:642-1046(-)